MVLNFVSYYPSETAKITCEVNIGQRESSHEKTLVSCHIPQSPNTRAGAHVAGGSRTSQAWMKTRERESQGESKPVFTLLQSPIKLWGGP